MTPEQIAHHKELFVKTCRSYIQREGLEALLDYLEEKTDFYTAPSSTNYHLNETGGLCKHSLNVFITAMQVYESTVKPTILDKTGPFITPLSEESIAIATLFHDLCKTKYYKQVEKWKKNKEGKWASYPAYEVDDQFPFGHGEKSCYIINWYMKLHPDELLAIRWHMGMFEMAPMGSSMSFSFRSALEQSPLVALVHAADFIASNLKEKTTIFI